MGKRANFDEVITSLYEAATDATLWRPALARMAELFDPCFGGHFFTWDRTKNVGFAEVDREELAAANEDYARYYSRIDPRAALAAERPVGWIFACHHHFDDAYVARSEFYQDFMIKIGGRYIAGMKVADNSQHASFATIHRNSRQGPFERDDLRLLKRLQPHLTQAASLFHKFADLRAARDHGMATLDRLPWAIIVVSRDAKILEMNAAAERHLKSGEVLRSRGGRVEAATNEHASDLHRMIANAADAAGGKACMPGGVLRLDRPSGDGYLIALAAPLRPARSEVIHAATSAAILFITDSEDQPLIPAAWLDRLYGLTAAESAVALALAAGKTLDEIAEMNGVTKNTVRVQTQSILDKTGARRQAELVSMLSRIPNIR